MLWARLRAAALRKRVRYALIGVTLDPLTPELLLDTATLLEALATVVQAYGNASSPDIAHGFLRVRRLRRLAAGASWAPKLSTAEMLDIAFVLDALAAETPPMIP